MSDQTENRNYGAAPPNGAGTPWAPTPPTAPIPPEGPNGSGRRGGVWAGLLLIGVGLVFLAGQVVPGIAWWNLWPLIVVLVGVIQMFTPSGRDEWGPERILDGLGTVIIGCVLLGNALGIVSWSVWWIFITLWPVLIVALGISLLGKGLKQSWMRALSPLLIWAALGYSVAVSLTGVGGLQAVPQLVRPSASGQPFAYAEPVNGATTGTLRLRGGAGDIQVRGGNDLVNASGVSPFGTPSFSVARGLGSANVDLTLGDSNGAVVVPGISSGRAEVALSQTTVWDITFETGATNLSADLSSVAVDKLSLKTGASSASLKLGQVPATATSTDVSVRAGVSSIEILVPRDASVQVITHNGLATTNVDSRLSKMGSGLWQTPDFSSASKVINVNIETGISSVSVRTY